MPELTPATTTLRPDEPLPKHLRPSHAWTKLWIATKNSLNFYRVHLLFFTIFFSALMYASNEQFHIDYVDCLFNCVSAMTVCGLATSNLSTMTSWQQTILFIQMCIGSPITVSLVMIAVRRHFFRVKFRHVIETHRRKKSLSEKRSRRLSFLSRAPSRWSTNPAGPSGADENDGTVAGSPPEASAGTSTAEKVGETSAGSSNCDEPGKSPLRAQMYSSGYTFPSQSRAAAASSSSPSPNGLGSKGPFKSFASIFNRLSPNSDFDEESIEERKERKFAKKTARLEQERARKLADQAEKARRSKGGGGGRVGGLHTSMIRRVEGEEPMLVNSAGLRGGMAVDRTDFELNNIARSEASADEHNQAEVETPIETNPRARQGEAEEAEQPTQEETEDRYKGAEHPRLKHIGQMTESPAGSGSDSLGFVEPEEILARSNAGRPRRVSEPVLVDHPPQPPQPVHDTFPRSKTIAFDPEQINPSHAAHHASHTGLNGDHNYNHNYNNNNYNHGNDKSKNFTRTGTIEFVEGDAARLGRRNGGGTMFERTATRRSEGAGTIYGPSTSLFPRTMTNRTAGGRSTKHSGFGGFPMPHEIISSVAAWLFPKATEKLTRTLTMQRTGTFASARSAGAGTIYGPGGPKGGGGVVKSVPYITFDAVVGRNSQFKDLSSDQLEELGGVEYRALKVLLWIIPCYYVGVQLLGWVIIWPYVNSKFRDVFSDPTIQKQDVEIGWFSAFQVVSAFSNTGMSLVDTSMVPFQTGYIMIVYLIFLILAGNTAYVSIVYLYELQKKTKSDEGPSTNMGIVYTAYLPSSHDTLFLLMVIVLMTMTDWISFLVLDIGTPAIESIPVGTRIASAFLQSAAVRAAGFAIVPLSALAPAVKVLYTIMMYISVYPIAMSVRATNVYEERSLGLFGDEDQESLDEESFVKVGGESRMAGFTRYVSFHARRQLAFDIWWLALALWLVCIIERGQINESSSESYFNIFSILFELVSAYGTVGLSLGLSFDNYSLSGGFKVLSKLVVCAVMIRGRHRGLPVAIDRAVMLPNEFAEEDAEVAEEERSRQSRRGSTYSFRQGPMDVSYGHVHNRRASTFSAHVPRPGPPQPFFLPSATSDLECAVDDDDDDDNEYQRRSADQPVGGSALPGVHSVDWTKPPGIGRLGGGAPGSLTPVKEMMSRRPSVDTP
ncbi:-domain-containing protein [Phaffia rhodozyma]|uniref:-domain-containing protein n=1 Tax=Phaffia rhodozyma TaxID=264483 RepID=A0A0F7SLY4_PHARH|nr:-domain-containing protein [Phaffia rhodozyma]